MRRLSRSCRRPPCENTGTRRGVAEWLVVRLAEAAPTLVGIDHGFSFPPRYFEVHGLSPDWPAFLDDFQRRWPTDDDHIYVDFVRDGLRVAFPRFGGHRIKRLGALPVRGPFSDRSRVAGKWKMPPREWCEAKTQLAIMFDERFVTA